MDLRIGRIDNAIVADVNGVAIDGVVDYKIITSAHGGTEVELKIKVDDSFTDLELSTS